MQTELRLSAAEATAAAYAGVDRRIASMRAGLTDRFAALGRDAWGADIEGAAAEAFVAKLLGMPQELAINAFHAPDIGGIQVRQTGHPQGQLVVRERDNPDHAFVLVVGSLPSYRAAGWAWGRDVMQERWAADFGQPGLPRSWGMPQGALEPMDTLPYDTGDTE